MTQTSILILLLLLTTATLMAWLFWRARHYREEQTDLDFLDDSLVHDPLELPPSAIAADTESVALSSHPLSSFTSKPATENAQQKKAIFELNDDHYIEEPVPPAPPPPKPSSEIFIIFYLSCPRAEGFHGMDVLSVLERLGFVFGEMKIFHHYGLHATDDAPEPVFSVANLVEPGSFNIEQLPHSAIPGLTLFMRLPGPLDNRVAFEFMLSQAHRLSEILHGRLLDERKQPLTQERLLALRDRIES